MSNHYHLVLETPEPNLVEGMVGLQSDLPQLGRRAKLERAVAGRSTVSSEVGNLKRCLPKRGAWRKLCHEIAASP